jgi:hypothetical protein
MFTGVFHVNDYQATDCDVQQNKALFTYWATEIDRKSSASWL